MNWLLLVAAFPLIWRFLAPLVPPQYIEPYAYWDPAALNTEVGGRVPRWRNMGYWKTGKETFTEANEALANKLVTFADAKLDGHTLDMAHGAGESLLIHLANGATLDALTSLPAETAAAQELVEAWSAEKGVTPAVTWFTMSAGYRANKDLEHPLNPMRGFMGEDELQGGSGQVVFDDDDEPAEPAKKEEQPKPAEDTKFDLVYVLDAAYHFPPGMGFFLASVLPALRDGGVLAYTDILPPPAMSKLPLMLTAGWLAPMLSVPRRNLNERPASTEEYTAQLEQIGYEGVRIEDWTEHVFAPLADALEKRGAAWFLPAQMFRLAQRTGWKFVAVRAAKPSKPQAE